MDRAYGCVSDIASEPARFDGIVGALLSTRVRSSISDENTKADEPTAGSSSSPAAWTCAGMCRAAYGLAIGPSEALLNAAARSGSRSETIRVP